MDSRSLKVVAKIIALWLKFVWKDQDGKLGICYVPNSTKIMYQEVQINVQKVRLEPKSQTQANSYLSSDVCISPAASVVAVSGC